MKITLGHTNGHSKKIKIVVNHRHSKIICFYIYILEDKLTIKYFSRPRTLII